MLYSIPDLKRAFPRASGSGGRERTFGTPKASKSVAWRCILSTLRSASFNAEQPEVQDGLAISAVTQSENPPWLSYRYISDPEYQDEIKRRAVERYTGSAAFSVDVLF
jgi:hypothetical protein